MTLEISLDPAEHARLQQCAAAAGKDVATFAKEAVIEKVDRPSLLDLLAPVHDDTRRRGISVEQVDETVERAKQAFRRERQDDQSAA
jgi:hypothetical protein